MSKMASTHPHAKGRLLRLGVTAVLTRFFRLRVKGRDLLPEPIERGEGRLLIVANHQSAWDPILLGAALSLRDLIIVVHPSVARSWARRRLIGLYGEAEELRLESDHAAGKLSEWMKSGRPVLVFPEGRPTDTGALGKTLPAPAIAAASADATIVPVNIDGLLDSRFERRPWRRRKLRPRVTVTVRPPSRWSGLPPHLARRQAVDSLRRVMEHLVMAPPAETLYEAFARAVRRHGGRRVVVRDVRPAAKGMDPVVPVRTYADLRKITLAFQRLVRNVAAPGDCVGLLLPNIIETICLILGLSSLGRVPALLNYTAGLHGLQAACASAELRVIITSRAFLAQVDLSDRLDALSGVERVIYLEDLTGGLSRKDKLWVLGRSLCRWDRARRQGEPGDPAVVLFTSGSEGTPKGVVLSHRAILANIAQIHAVADFTSDDVVFNALPLFHSFGLTAGVLLPILTGAALVLYPSPLHYQAIPQVVYAYRCTVMFGTASFLARYGRTAHPYDFHRLRFVVVGAEKLAPEVNQLWFRKFGIRLLEGYGATETGPVISANVPLAFRPDTVGQVLPGLEYRLLPVEGISAGGVLHVKGPNVMNGYLKMDRPGVLQEVASEAGAGWYNTGDIVEIDPDGFVSIVGRAKRFAKLGGEMVSLEAIERLARTVSPGHQHAALSRPDLGKGEVLLLCTTDPGLNHKSLHLTAKASGVPELWVPRRITHMEALPVLSSGKVDYVALLASAAADAAEAVGASLSEKSDSVSGGPLP
ncbi:MAG: AMP-binding protein [Propionibacteriaceae bacterium]|jgi:acyl-[acyl-carrier-protein]-phospholipid O-acyltransferase/long-chain-fatty-acid--[acyl-carrier-protein] ligase|nr:AMP-binding protein [Propionibacteriaceae bacterium]